METCAWSVVSFDYGHNFLHRKMGVGDFDQLAFLKEVQQLGNFKCYILFDRVGGTLTLGKVFEDCVKGQIELIKYALAQFEVFLKWHFVRHT